MAQGVDSLNKFVMQVVTGKTAFGGKTKSNGFRSSYISQWLAYILVRAAQGADSSNNFLAQPLTGGIIYHAGIS